MPLELKIRGKSTTQSHRTPIYYVDITVRDGLTLEEAITQAKATDQQRRDSGFNQQALDSAAKQGFGNGIFEESESEIAEVIEEFYPLDNEEENLSNTAAPSEHSHSPGTSALAGKLRAKAAQSKSGS